MIHSNPNSETNTNEGRLIMLLTVSFYVLFTLIPDSHSLMVQWPWVFIWQVGLLCPIIWLFSILWYQGKIQVLGNGLDWVVGLGIIGLIISTLVAQFPNPARWYSWAALGGIAGLYACNHWLNSPERRYHSLVKQGYLNIAFIITSLSLWTFQTLLPELNRLNSLKQYGVNLPFDFSVLELRNWAPLGHQNYVAGYLLLTISLLVSLWIVDTQGKRWLWGIGIGLGLLDLYTTSSRGGWLGLVGFLLFGLGVLLLKSSISRRWLGLGSLGTVVVLLVLILANNRLLTLIKAILTGQAGGEFTYRFINAVIGGRMGSDYPFSGIGLGGVTLLYQKYRPFWAGRESELAYQLHSTPVQLWAELGIWGILTPLVGLVILGYHLTHYSASEDNRDLVFLWGLSGGLLGYGLMSLTDYQLDNIAISGSLIIFIACVASILKTSSVPLRLVSAYPRAFLFSGIGIVLAMIIWLFPIHRAWQLSSQGFMALSDKKVDIFSQYLTESEKLAPWEAYYPYQLGWNLGNLALTTPNPEQQQALWDGGIKGFQQGNKVSPYQEFGRSNLGWLLFNKNALESSQSFKISAQLVPAKHGVMYGLGLSLLAQKKPDLGVQAIVLEGLRDPLFIASLSRRLPTLEGVIIDRILNNYSQLLEQNSQPGAFNTYLHQARGGLLLWQGNLKVAHEDLDKYGSPLTQGLLKLAEGNSPESILSQWTSFPSKLVLESWINPNQRVSLLRKAWIEATKENLSSDLEQQLLESMNSSDNFIQWLKEKSPMLEYRHQRSGFGVLSRHIDGPLPLDFFPVIDNVAVTNWFSELLPSPNYDPQLDKALQPWRDSLLSGIK